MLKAIISKRDFESRVEDEDGNIIADGLSRSGAELFSMADKYEAFVASVAAEFMEEIDYDRPINGSDAVEVLTGIIKDARKLIEEANALET